MNIEDLMGIEKLNILQCQEIAKKMGFNSLKFTLHGPSGSLECRWLDAYMGLFISEEHEGKMFGVKDFQFVSDLWCSVPIENIDNSTPAAPGRHERS